MKTIKGSKLANKTLEVLENGTLRIIKKGRFIPKIGECYWYIDNFGRVCQVVFENDEADKWILKHHLVFETEVEALECKVFLELLHEFTFKPDWNNGDQEKNRILYGHIVKKIIILNQHVLQYGDLNYFETREKAIEFIEKAGEENIKKFMFDVWE